MHSKIFKVRKRLFFLMYLFRMVTSRSNVYGLISRKNVKSKIGVAVEHQMLEEPSWKENKEFWSNRTRK